MVHVVCDVCVWCVWCVGMCGVLVCVVRVSMVYMGKWECIVCGGDGQRLTIVFDT